MPASRPEARPPSQILADIADIRRHLVDAPPHSGAGTRQRLQQHLEALERELRSAHAKEKPT